MNCGLGHKRGKNRAAVATLVYSVPGGPPVAYARLAVCDKHALAALRLGHTLAPIQRSGTTGERVAVASEDVPHPEGS